MDRERVDGLGVGLVGGVQGGRAKGAGAKLEGGGDGRGAGRELDNGELIRQWCGIWNQQGPQYSRTADYIIDGIGITARQCAHVFGGETRSKYVRLDSLDV